jgi:queuine tRNA-ribosyltransferase
MDYHRNREKKSKAKKPSETPPGPETFPKDIKCDYFSFEVVHRSTKPGSHARVGKLTTPHGVIHTPTFVPVGTNGALKAVTSEQAEECDIQLMFANTYHLLVHPGAETVAKAGGVHKFMRRDRPIITDSGGFQVFSLADISSEDGPELKSKRKRNEGGSGSLVKLDEEGTVFRSYINGQLIKLTPETSVQAQKKIGADIIIPLDELPPYHVTPERLRTSVLLSHRWMARSLQEHLRNPKQQAMYGVVHGGIDKELRQMSVDYLSSLPFNGYAVGGSLGKDRTEMVELLSVSSLCLCPCLCPNEARAMKIKMLVERQ